MNSWYPRILVMDNWQKVFVLSWIARLLLLLLHVILILILLLHLDSNKCAASSPAEMNEYVSGDDWTFTASVHGKWGTKE